MKNRFPSTLVTALGAVSLLATTACFGPSNASSTPENPRTAANVSYPVRPAHVVIVIEENHAYSDIAGNPEAPFIHHLMNQGATFTNYHAIEHPSQPNYLDLFAGWNEGITDDSTPHTFTGPNLASELLAAHKTFAGYSENLPYPGYLGITDPATGTYARKHNPWADFSNVPSKLNLPLTKFPTKFANLPTVSFVIPTLDHDMHDGAIAEADTWLHQHMGRYVQWARSHNSLLIVTWDEDDGSTANQVGLILDGAMVIPGKYDQRLNHFNLLSTLEAMYGLPRLGHTKTAAPISGVWKKSM